MSASPNPGGPLLVGYDGSDPSHDALALARLLAPLTGSEVVVLAVITLAPTEATWVEYERIQREEIEQLEREARSALSDLPQVEFRSVMAPSPAHELHEAADTVGARMIVLGSTHRGPLGRVLPGSVADRLLSAAPCPIAVAPRGFADHPAEVESVAVAYDASPESKLALDAASAIAAGAGATLRLISIANPHDARLAVPAASGWAGLVTTREGVEEERRRVAHRLDDALAGLDPRFGASGEVIVDTDPGRVLAEASEDVDLLVTGSRGYGPLGRVLLGGVSSAVVRRSVCPVLVTARPSDTPDSGE